MPKEKDAVHKKREEPFCPYLLLLLNFQRRKGDMCRNGGKPRFE